MASELSITDIDDHIAILQHLCSLFPRSGVSSHALALVRLARYQLSQRKEDLDKCILHYAKAILLPPASLDELSLNVVGLLLAFFLLLRSEKFAQTEGIKYSIEHLRYLRGLPIPLDSFHPLRNLVTQSLIKVLAAQVMLEERDGTRNINEMVVLCRELLTTKVLTDDLAATFSSLNEAIYAQFDRGWTLSSIDEVTECLRDAVKMCPPDSYRVLLALASTLYIRFTQTRLIDDYEEATTLLERILDADQPGGCPDSIRGQASSLVVSLELSKLVIFKNPLHSEVTIPRLRTLLGSSSIDEGLRLEITGILAGQARQRFKQYSLAESLEEANSYTTQLSSSQSLEILEERFPVLEDVRNSYSVTRMAEVIQRLEKLRSNTPPGTSRHRECLRDLASWYSTKFSHTNDVSDIEESIKYSRLLLDASHSGDWRVSRLFLLHDDLVRAFKRTDKFSYLDESITVAYDILESRGARPVHFYATRKLASSLLTREELLGGTARGIEHTVEVIRLISMVIDDQYAQEPDRFHLSCQWAILARNINHPITLTAYKSTMLLLQKSLSFTPTVTIQHARLVAMGEFCQTMPLDYASFQIELGRFEEAIETLEQGRALLWSEMRGLRTPMAKLIEDDPLLAKRFAEINQELEALIISVTPSGKPEMEDGIAQGEDGTDAFGRLVVKRQKLMEERDALIPQIRGRPGLEGFLKAPSFTTLRSVASLEARKHGLDSSDYQDALCFAFQSNLESGGAPRQSFVLFPFTQWAQSHRAGTSEAQYFSDLYIPSYTPSLSALIESRQSSRQILDKPSLLLVAQPDDSLPGVKGEIKAIRSLEPRVTVANLVSSEATPSSVVENLRGNRFAHFACHGVLETGKPFETSFKLHGSSRLTLLDIARSRLPDAEFAFLSCCHAAEITENSIADEALHLTAAMQYCGFRSVVGTMWEMADTDGRDLAKTFYKSLFSNQETSVPYYERSARALRDTTRMLRGKRGITLERWVNFVHYGA
ncbi:CHAT domain-containing protein [Lactarius indigo]|nr:CHAT domain-containing protein [Lactarius indigo]